MKLRLLPFLCSAVLAWTSVAPAAERVALVVGCANYRADPTLVLDTPVQDARDLGALLASPALGFEVIPVLDATVEDFYAGLRKFKDRAKGARLALVYFSGHGIEHGGQNYLITVNAVLDSEDQLDTQTMNLERVMKDLGGTDATVKLAILDCCRNNPFAPTKSWMKTKAMPRNAVLRALGEAEIPEATLVCFATSAGRKAAALLNENSKNSPFTEFLLDEMPKPGQSLRTIFENVHDRISRSTAGRQVPTLRTDDALSEIFRNTVLVAAKTPSPSSLPPSPEGPREESVPGRAPAVAPPKPLAPPQSDRRESSPPAPTPTRTTQSSKTKAPVAQRAKPPTVPKPSPGNSKTSDDERFREITRQFQNR